MPRASVIIPAYNAAQTISATIDSALSQTFRDIEVIVVDDGSSDETAELVRRSAARDPRLRLIHQDNAGVAAARNAGLRAARGSWIAPLDADDLWHEEKIAKQLVRVDSEPSEPILVYCWTTEIDADDVIIAHRRDVDRYEGDVVAALITTNFIGNGSVPLIRKDALLQLGGWDPSLRAAGAEGCEDWLLYLELAGMGPVLLAPAFLVGYRQQQGAMSRSLSSMTRSFQQTLAEARQKYPDLPSCLFRWSKAGFFQYRAELRMESNETLRAAADYARAFALDPSWLARPSIHKRIRGLIARVGLPADKRSGGDLATPPIGRSFRDLDPELDYHVGEGGIFATRRRQLSTISSR